jgi:hypothetical protein
MEQDGVLASGKRRGDFNLAVFGGQFPHHSLSIAASDPGAQRLGGRSSRWLSKANNRPNILQLADPKG